MKKNAIFVLILVLVGLIVYLVWRDRNPADDTNKQSPSLVFAAQASSNHIKNVMPVHASTVSVIPTQVSADFSLQLESDSTMAVQHNGKDIDGKTFFGSDGLSMSRTLTGTLSSGIYTVTYQACLTDKTCENGSWEFAIAKDATVPANTNTATNTQSS